VKIRAYRNALLGGWLDRCRGCSGVLRREGTKYCSLCSELIGCTNES
jgi:hypothetical protein